MARTIYLEEDTIVEVGKYYMVPCAVQEKWGDKAIKQYTPIIGPPHADKQFGFEHEHYHIDCRFIKKDRKKVAYTTVSDHGKTANVIVIDKAQPVYFAGIERHRLKCVRTTTGLLMPPVHSVFSLKYLKWYEGMVGKSCKGKRCPHLGTKMHERHGVLVCPLHNLCGDIETETIIECKSEYDIEATKRVLRSFDMTFDEFVKTETAQ